MYLFAHHSIDLLYSYAVYLGGYSFIYLFINLFIESFIDLSYLFVYLCIFYFLFLLSTLSEMHFYITNILSSSVISPRVSLFSVAISTGKAKNLKVVTMTLLFPPNTPQRASRMQYSSGRLFPSMRWRIIYVGLGGIPQGSSLSPLLLLLLLLYCL